MRSMPSLRVSLSLALVFGSALGCSDDGNTDSNTTNETTGTGTDSDTSTSTGTDSDTGTASDSATTTTTTTTTDTTATTTTTTTGVEPQPDGAMCTADAECISGSCFLVPLLGGICGECKVDADCDGGGCTIPNPLQGQGATCNEGEAGAGCESDAVCVDPNNAICGLVLDATPIIKVQTCGECKSNADCTDDALPNCSPEISVSDFSGILTCVADGSVANNSACNHVEQDGVPIGNAACESGKCGTAVVMGVVQIGVCGECFTDDDCMGGTCQDAAVDTDTLALIGSKCM